MLDVTEGRRVIASGASRFLTKHAEHRDAYLTLAWAKWDGSTWLVVKQSSSNTMHRYDAKLSAAFVAHLKTAEPDGPGEGSQ